MKEIVIDGKVFVEKSFFTQEAHSDTEFVNFPYVIVRTYNAGVFAGYLESHQDQEVVLRNARRIWHWEGAQTLSELAMIGTKRPAECKFPMEVDKIELLTAIEILYVTPQAKKSIKEVAIWSC